MRSFTILFLLLTLDGCSSCGDKPAGADASSSASPVVIDKRPPRKRGSSNAASAFVDAATNLDLDAATRGKVEHLDEGLESDDTKAAVIYKGYRIELAGQVRANKIDPAKLETYYADMAAGARAREEKAAVVFNGLHAALTPEQRVKVSTKVKADQTLREMRSLRGRHRPSGQRTLLMGLTRGLELDGKQLKEIDALLPPESPDAGAADPKRIHFREVADAFAHDPFDARQHLFDEKEARAALEDQTKLVEKMLKILTEKQREKLAGLLDETAKQPDGIEEH